MTLHFFFSGAGCCSSVTYPSGPFHFSTWQPFIEVNPCQRSPGRGEQNGGIHGQIFYIQRPILQKIRESKHHFQSILEEFNPSTTLIPKTIHTASLSTITVKPRYLVLTGHSLRDKCLWIDIGDHTYFYLPEIKNSLIYPNLLMFDH